MTHSPNRDTGIGDYGQAGIDSFLNEHVCDHICVAFGFKQLFQGQGESSHQATAESATSNNLVDDYEEEDN